MWIESWLKEKHIKRHLFQMSNAWEKVVGSQSLLSLLLAKPTFFVRCLCKITSLLCLRDQT